MSDTGKKIAPVETPRIAIEALTMAQDGFPNTPVDSCAAAAAQISGAASLLMIAELLETMVKEMRQLRAVLCTRRPAV